jgi:hypothetical protein
LRDKTDGNCQPKFNLQLPHRRIIFTVFPQSTLQFKASNKKSRRKTMASLCVFVVKETDDGDDLQVGKTVSISVNGSKMSAKTDENGSAFFEVPDESEVDVSCSGASESIVMEGDTADVTLYLD